MYTVPASSQYSRHRLIIAHLAHISSAIKLALIVPKALVFGFFSFSAVLAFFSQKALQKVKN